MVEGECRVAKSNKIKCMVFHTAIILTIAYMVWRVVFTLPFEAGMPSMVLAMLLLLVEIIHLACTIEQLTYKKDKKIPGVRLRKEEKRVLVAFNDGNYGVEPNDLQGLIEQYRNSILASKVYWGRTICRGFFIIIPIVACFCDLVILNEGLVKSVYVWIVFYCIFELAIKLNSDGYRNARVNNFYDTAMFSYVSIPVIFEKLGIKKHSQFKSRKKYVYLIPHILLIAASIIGIVICAIKTVNDMEIYHILVMMWLISNTYMLVFTVFFLFGRKRERKVERYSICVNTVIKTDKFELEAKTIDMSETGISVETDFPEYISEEENVEMVINAGDTSIALNGQIVYFTNYGDKYKGAFYITDIDEENRNKYLKLLYNREPEYKKISWVDISIIGEIIAIIRKRKEQGTRNLRKLARIDLYKELKTSSGKEVMLYNFCYEYMLVGHKKGQKVDREIEVVFEDGLVVKGDREYEKLSFPDEDRVVVLYQISNLSEFIQNENLKILLRQWADEYKA